MQRTCIIFRNRIARGVCNTEVTHGVELAKLGSLLMKLSCPCWIFRRSDAAVFHQCKLPERISIRLGAGPGKLLERDLIGVFVRQTFPLPLVFFAC
jgi:hypothetical protein